MSLNIHDANGLRKMSQPTFNWFLCSQRIMDTSQGLYYILISPDVQFYCPETGESLTASGLTKPGGEVIRSKLLLLSDSHNKKILRRSGYPLKCDSDRSILSTRCELVTDQDHLLELTQHAIDLGYDGVAIQHDCIGSLNSFICKEATFVFRSGVLEEIAQRNEVDGEVSIVSPQRCRMVKYAKKRNSCIRSVIPEFPDCYEIDRLLKNNRCPRVSKMLYQLIMRYFEVKRGR